ncbi:MAG: hypothetical protein AAB459_02375 [Patescibacteria group bacterium]
MLKECTVCRVQKQSTDFYWKKQSLGKLHSQCKQCYKAKRKFFMQAHYEKYGDAYRQRARLRKSRLKKERQEKLVTYLKDKFCLHCGINDIRVLDFDHIDPTQKRFTIARAVNEGYNWNVILKEIDKCRILCANCHRIRTAEQFNWHKWHLDRMVR